MPTIGHSYGTTGVYEVQPFTAVDEDGSTVCHLVRHEVTALEAYYGADTSWVGYTSSGLGISMDAEPLEAEK